MGCAFKCDLLKQKNNSAIKKKLKKTIRRKKVLIGKHWLAAVTVISPDMSGLLTYTLGSPSSDLLSKYDSQATRSKDGR